MRKLHIVLILLITTGIYSQEVSPNPTRPSVADNGYLTNYGYTEIELGWFGQDHFWSIPALLKVTPVKRLEVGLAMSGIVNHSEFLGKEETELGDFGVQLKGQILRLPEIAIALVARADFLPESNTRGLFYSAFSFPRRHFQVDITFGGYSMFEADKFDPVWIWAGAIGSNLESPFNFYLEVFGEKYKDFAPLGFDAGISYDVHPGLVLDAAYFTSLNDDGPEKQFHIGFTKTLFSIID